MSDISALPSISEKTKRYIKAFVAEAAYDGWSSSCAVERAAKAAETTAFEIKRLVGKDARSRMRSFALYQDEAMRERAAQQDFSHLSVRDKVRALVMARIQAAEALPMGREALRKALHYYAFSGVTSAPQAAWRTADLIWRLCGDRSVDMNYYSKRALLSGVYASVALYALNDESEGLQETSDFTERRLHEVVAFGRFFASLKPRSS